MIPGVQRFRFKIETMRFLAVIMFLLVCSASVAASCRNCGKKTSEVPASSSTSEYVDAGQTKSLRGRVLYPNGEEAELVIIEVYRNDLTIPANEMTYVESDQILKAGRIAARDTETSGRFCFKKLPAGNYMLRVNTIGKNSQFSTMYIFVTLVPKSKENVELEVRLTFAI